MKTGTLIKRFETHTRAPIKINDVRNHILQARVQDEINFVGVVYDVSVLRGKLVQYCKHSGPYSEPTFVSDIYYDKKQPMSWRRLVCCKEMMHILDPEMFKAKTVSQVSQLIAKIALPPDLAQIVQESENNIAPDAEYHTLRAMLDQYTDVKAVATLFPIAIRELILPKFNSGALTLSDIASLLDIPVRYVSLVMSPSWPNLYDALKAT